MNPILRSLNHIASKDLFFSSVHVSWLLDGAVLRANILRGDTEDKDFMPFVWCQLPGSPWEEVESWVHEAAWRSGARAWNRREEYGVLGPSDLLVKYGPRARQAVGVDRHKVWVFSPCAWIHPILLQCPFFRRLTRPLDDMPSHQPGPMIRHRKFSGEPSEL